MGNLIDDVAQDSKPVMDEIFVPKPVMNEPIMTKFGEVAPIKTGNFDEARIDNDGNHMFDLWKG